MYGSLLSCTKFLCVSLKETIQSLNDKIKITTKIFRVENSIIYCYIAYHSLP